MKSRSLEGRHALVTGGTRGIGRAVAVELAARGCDVAVNFLRSRQAANETVDELAGMGVTAFHLRGNVGNPAHIEKIMAAVAERFGSLEILVSNAALGPLKPAIELDEAEWQRAIDINARAFLLLARRAVPLMSQGGKLVTITSMGADRVLPDYAGVGAAKAALEALTRYLAVELADRDINANCVAGGVVDTESLKPFPKRKEMLEIAAGRTPAGRLGTPEDIARVVAFLCTKDADWIRGQTIVADGGYSLLG